jgi:hypothetical protein
MRGFGAQLPEALQAVRIQRTRRDGRKDGAAGLDLMLAVAETTPHSELVNLWKSEQQSFIKIPDTQLA